MHTPHTNTSNTPQTTFHSHIQTHRQTHIYTTLQTARFKLSNTARTLQHSYNYNAYRNSGILTIRPHPPTCTHSYSISHANSNNLSYNTTPDKTYPPKRPEIPKLRIPRRSRHSTIKFQSNHILQHTTIKFQYFATTTQNLTETPTPTNIHHWQHIFPDRQNPQRNARTDNIPHN